MIILVIGAFPFWCLLGIKCARTLNATADLDWSDRPEDVEGRQQTHSTK